MYDCEKGEISGKDLASYLEEEYIEATMHYELEDFGTFAPIRMSHKPNKPTTIKLIFVRKSCLMESIKVLFGFEEKVSKVRLDGNTKEHETTDYINTITFESRFVKELKESGIDSVEAVMD